MIDVQKPEQTLITIEEARRHFEKGGAVPNTARALILELADAIADSGPLEMGISPRRWVRAQGSVMDAVKSLRDDRVGVQVGGAMRGFRAARRAFRLGAWSAHWRRRFGESARAMRIQLAVMLVVAVCVATAGEILLHGDFRPGYFVAGLVFAMFFWGFIDERAVRLGDAALARAATRELAVGHRALSAARLMSEPRKDVELAIATDHGVLAARRMSRRRWEELWFVPYAQITSFASDESARPRSVSLDAGERRLVLEYRWRQGESRGDYQGEHRTALLTILDRRTRPMPSQDGPASAVDEQRDAAAAPTNEIGDRAQSGSPERSSGPAAPRSSTERASL
jgi:hypothetical protein